MWHCVKTHEHGLQSLACCSMLSMPAVSSLSLHCSPQVGTGPHRPDTKPDHTGTQSQVLRMEGVLIGLHRGSIAPWSASGSEAAPLWTREVTPWKSGASIQPSGGSSSKSESSDHADRYITITSWLHHDHRPFLFVPIMIFCITFTSFCMFSIPRL